MRFFRRCSELFPAIILDQKEKLVDAILRGATVNKDKVEECEFYAAEDTDNVRKNWLPGLGDWAT